MVLTPLLSDRVRRIGLVATAVAALVAWPALWVAVGDLPAGPGWAGGGTLALLAGLAGRILADPETRSGGRRVLRLFPAAAGILAVVVGGLVWMLARWVTPSADPATLRLLAVTGILTLPVLIALQLFTLRVLRAGGASAGWIHPSRSVRPPTRSPTRRRFSMSPLFIVLLVAHIFAAVMFIGGATIASAVFPRYLDWHWSVDEGGVNPAGDPPRRQEQVLRALARITRGYGAGALLVPLLGLVLAFVDDRLGEAWLNISLVLTAVAAYLLIIVVRTQDAQMRVIRAGDTGGDAVARKRDLGRMRLAANSFNTVWLIILVLMVWRPGGRA